MRTTGALACTMLIGIGCGHAAVNGTKSVAIQWPADAELVHVELLTSEVVDKSAPAAPVQLVEHPPAASLERRSCEIIAHDAGRQTPLPETLAGALPGCWLDPTFVPGTQEVCFVGGYINDGGRHVDVDGGFCYTAKTASWRAVRLDRVPTGLGGGESVSRTCMAVRPGEGDGDGPALRCEIRAGGHESSPGGSSFVEMTPVEYRVETIRLTGIH